MPVILDAGFCLKSRKSFLHKSKNLLWELEMQPLNSVGLKENSGIFEPDVFPIIVALCVYMNSLRLRYRDSGDSQKYILSHKTTTSGQAAETPTYAGRKMKTGSRKASSNDRKDSVQ